MRRSRERLSSAEDGVMARRVKFRDAEGWKLRRGGEKWRERAGGSAGRNGRVRKGGRTR